ncbi:MULTISPECIES: hypothetical protein [unclassified Haladaptatus]|uniref:hypothetical protein n=1 Tax=unclassified Haladaptatus TaxID=2622732 RepID=UPI002FCE1F24
MPSSERSEDDAPTEAVDENYVFDPEETTFTLTDRHAVSKFDVKDMEKMDILSVELTEKDGKTVVTDCTIDMTAFASVVGELDVVERKMGNDWRETSWNPRVRLKYLR